jgi:hypothetical protein
MTIVTALTPPQPTHPAFMDAPRLQATCDAEGPDAPAAKAVCIGYVMGVVDQLMTRSARRGGPTFCPSADFNARAAV